MMLTCDFLREDEVSRLHIISDFDDFLRTFELHHFRKASYQRSPSPATSQIDENLIKMDVIWFHIISDFDDFLRTFELHHFRKASYQRSPSPATRKIDQNLIKIL